MMASTQQYSPFQKELINSLSQINSNINTLINVFVTIQSSIHIHPPSNINSVPILTKNTNANNSKNIKKVKDIPNIANKKITKNINPTQSDKKQQIKLNQSISVSPKIKKTIKNVVSVPNDLEEGKDELKGDNKYNDDDDDDDEPVLSLDSSDTDDDNNNTTKPKKNNLSISNKYNGNGFSSSNWKNHRSKFSFNRSKSTTSTSSSASMSTLLRANHIRTHKYGLKNKYKFSKNNKINKSDKSKYNKYNGSGNGNGNGGPAFNPEHIFLSKNNRVLINVGGSTYETTINTLSADQSSMLSADQSSMLSAMFSGRFKIERDDNGAIFVDRDPTHFRHILNFLRDGIDYLKHGGLLQQPDAIVNELLQEAKYYNIRPLVDYIQLQQTRKNKKKGDELTHEKQYKLVPNIAIDEFVDVFNKYTGSAGYDFEQWLYVSPYKTSRNSSSTPAFSMLFSKKLSRAEVRLLDRLTNIDFQ